jgi:hypothetical protein
MTAFDNFSALSFVPFVPSWSIIPQGAHPLLPFSTRITRRQAENYAGR